MRSTSDRYVAGVCAAVANSLGLRSFSVRLATALAGVFSLGVAVAIYILLWIALPSDATPAGTR